MSLTLPGTLPGLLRRGSPVHGDNDMRGVVVRIDATSVAIAWDFPLDPENGDGCVVEDDYGLDSPSLSLDLEDVTGRAHAAWWLAAKVTKHPIILSARLGYRHSEHGGFGWWLDWESPTMTGEAMLNEPIEQALSGLNLHDPRILPDGSRWVDAEALRLVCLHVGGGA